MRFSIIKKNKVFQENYMKVGVKKLPRAGMLPARTWRVHAAGMAPTERLKLRRQMAAAAGKKSTTRLSLVVEVCRNSPPRLLAEGVQRTLDEADSGGLNVETGESACRSSDV